MTTVAGDAPAYCPFYCEENVWHLCAHPSVGPAERRVLIISNAAKRVAMWGQKAGPDPLLPIAWDYHVVLLLRGPDQPTTGWRVWDLDGCDPRPRAADQWLIESFRAGLLPPTYAPRFRMISCAEYRRYLRSDRRHMRQPDGTNKQPAPPWPLILGERPSCAPTDDGSNLERFLDTHDPAFLGELFGLAELGRWLGREARA